MNTPAKKKLLKSLIREVIGDMTDDAIALVAADAKRKEDSKAAVGAAIEALEKSPEARRFFKRAASTRDETIERLFDNFAEQTGSWSVAYAFSDGKGRPMGVRFHLNNLLNKDGYGSRSQLEAVLKVPDSIAYLTKRLKDYIPAREDFDEPEGGALGKVAFGEERIDSPPWEEDTDLEIEIYQALYGHIMENVTMTQEDVGKIREMMGSGKYTRFFKEPDAQVLYRGMTVGEEWLLAALGKATPEDLPASGAVSDAFEYEPNRGASSAWTASEKIADDFSLSQAHKLQYAVILTADRPRNALRFLELKDGFYTLGGFERYSHENEVIGLGNLSVKSVSWRRIRK